MCSEDSTKRDELEKLKVILERNEYPPEIVERSLAEFVESKAKVQQEKEKEPEKPIKRFLKLPYVNRKCEDYALRLKGIVEENFPQVEFNVAFQAPMTIGKMFPFKDGTRKVEERSLVVYSLRCEKCDAQYIGKTERIVYHRMKEHRTKKDSSCFKHTQENPTHSFNTDKVEILDSADSDKKLKLKELMYINSRRPEINKQHGSQSKHEIKTLIIATYPQFRPE